MCFESGSFTVWADALDVVLFHIWRLTDEGNEALSGLAADDLLVHVALLEVQDGAIFGILEDVEVTEVAEYVGEVLGCEVGALPFFELEMNDVLVPFLEVKSCPVWLLRIQGIAGTPAVLVHHHFVPIRSEELMLQIDGSSVQVLRLHITLRIICLLPSGASFLL